MHIHVTVIGEHERMHQFKRPPERIVNSYSILNYKIYRVFNAHVAILLATLKVQSAWPIDPILTNTMARSD